MIDWYSVIEIYLWVAVALYVIGWPIGVYVACKESYDWPDAVLAVLIGTIAGALAAAVWPLSLIVVVMWGLVGNGRGR